MGEEMEDMLKEQLAKPSVSCVTENGVSFLEQVICPLYDVIAAVCRVFYLSLCKITICVFLDDLDHNYLR